MSDINHLKLCIFFLFPQGLKAPGSWTRALWLFLPPVPAFLWNTQAEGQQPPCHHHQLCIPISMPITPCPSPSQLSPICWECGWMSRRQGAALLIPTQPSESSHSSSGNISSTPKLSQHYLPCLKNGDRIPSLGSHKEQTQGTQLWLAMFLCQLFFQICGNFCGCPLDSVHLDSRLPMLSHHACSESANSTFWTIVDPLVSIIPALQFPPNS